MVSLADDKFADPLVPDESYMDERAVMYDDDDPGGGSDAAGVGRMQVRGQSYRIGAPEKVSGIFFRLGTCGARP